MLLTTYSTYSEAWHIVEGVTVTMNPGLALALALPLGGIELHSEKAERQDQMLRISAWNGWDETPQLVDVRIKTRQVGRLIHRTSFLRYKIQAVLHFCFPPILGKQ